MKARARRWWLSAALLGCAPAPAAPVPLAPTPEPVPIAPAPPTVAPRPPASSVAPRPESALARLLLPGPGGPPDVVVSTPALARPWPAQPVLVVTHGAGGTAESHCEMWRSIVGPAGLLVCPRGYPINRLRPEAGFFYDGHPQLAAEIDASLAAVKRAYEGEVDLAQLLFAGYSQGANMGALALPMLDHRFSGAVFWEGGVGEHAEWSIEVARRLRARGTRRILFACGRLVCERHARRTVGYLRRAGLDVRAITVPGAGHTRQGELHTRVAKLFPWVAADRRWASPDGIGPPAEVDLRSRPHGRVSSP